MITLDFSFALGLYMSLFICAIFVFWIFGRKEKEKNLLLDPQFVWYCSVCTYTYINTKEEEVITVCPRCGSYNKKNRL